jgi:hypothetical protein
VDAFRPGTFLVYDLPTMGGNHVRLEIQTSPDRLELRITHANGALLWRRSLLFTGKNP